jgi:NAD(P)-dependent dehydrogenase (short-subunit alcohol dehydrogenase family)
VGRRPPPIGPGRVAAVTGAASGIGRALALALGRAGVHLALSDADEAGLAEVVDRVRGEGGVARGDVVDVTDAVRVQQWARDVVGQMGSVHMIWNVAGIINAGDVLRSDLVELHRLLAVDFWGVVHGTTAFLPVIVDAGGGNVVNVSSALGLVSAPSYGGYNAAKFAVRGWTDALRQEMRLAGTGVRVTCVYPGGVRTPIMIRSTSAAGDEDARRRREFFETRVARTDPDRAAATILRGVRAGRSRVLVGADAYFADALARLTATGYEHLLTAVQRRGRTRPASRS